MGTGTPQESMSLGGGGCSGRGRAVPTATPGLGSGGRGDSDHLRGSAGQTDIIYVKLLPLCEAFGS